MLAGLNSYIGVLLAGCLVMLFGCVYALNSVWKIIAAFREDYRRVNQLDEPGESEGMEE